MDKWKGYKKERKVGKFKWAFLKLCKLIRYFDVFGVKPNLNPSPVSGSFCGFFAVLLIITLSILTVAWTLSNYTTPRYQILQEFENENDFSQDYITDINFNLAACFTFRYLLTSTNRYA